MLFGEVLSCEQPELPGERLRVHRMHVAAVDQHGAVVRRELRRQPLQQGALPRAVRADEGRDRAGLGRDRLAVDDGSRCVRIPNTRLSASRALASPPPTESTVSLASVVPLGTSESVAFACSVDIQSSPMFCCLRIRYRKYGPPTSPVTIPTGICESAPVITLIPSRAPTSAPTMSAGPTNRQPTITRL